MPTYLKVIKINIINVFASVLVFAVLLSSQAFAGNSRHARWNYKENSGYSLSRLKKSLSQSSRLLLIKQQLQILKERSSRAHRHGRGDDNNEKPCENPEEPTPPPSIESLLTIRPTYNAVQDQASAAEWLMQNQTTSPHGLVSSFPEHPSLPDQGFTYDQALAGLVFLQSQNLDDAEKIFEFYNGQWDGSGFYTVYNSKSLTGPQAEIDKILGPNTWVALFSLNYYSKTNDARALELAEKIGKWALTLPRREGALAMGNYGTLWGTIFSVENNLDAYALFRDLSVSASSSEDRALFESEKNTIGGWLKSTGWNSNTGLFNRGGYADPTQALDTNAWAFLTFGIDALKNDFGINPDSLVASIEKNFLTQKDGSFGGNVFTAKGFDFSDSNNAALIGRSGLNWVEGTNHMISVYKKMAAYYSAVSHYDAVKAASYTDKANYFLNLNSASAASSNGNSGYLYADAAYAQVFSDVPNWRTPYGLSSSSTSWVYLALAGFNPFEDRLI